MLICKTKMKSDNNENKSTIAIESFLKNLSRSVGKEDKIENEDQLRLAQGRQKMDHRERRLEADLEKSRNKVEELKTDRSLKKRVALAVFSLLFVETSALFVILFFQGFSFQDFMINNTTLNIFAPATILQISSMAIIITKYLFSTKR